MIERLLEDDEGVVDRRVGPSLLALLKDQAALIDPEKGDRNEPALRGGFSDRREVIMWYQRAGVRTLGHIEDEWDPLDCVDDTTLLSALVQFSFGDITPMTPIEAEIYRDIVESEYVIPACNRAYRDLRNVASDYIQRPGNEGGEMNRADRNLDPSKQTHIAMRPGFQTVDRQQRLALEEFWGGFGDVAELEDWVLGLNSPTRGEIDETIAEETVSDDVAIGYLVHDTESREARRYQDFFVATVVLPAFVEAVRSMDMDELAKATRETPQTFRMKGGQHE